MSKTYQLGIFGCGDFLRWQAGDLKKSKQVQVKSLFDPDRKRAEKFAGDLGGQVVDSPEAIFSDPAIDVVLLFVPPWLRKDLIAKAVSAGKHILATKPLGPKVADCLEMVKAVQGKVRCGLIYRRTGNGMVETLKKIFTGGEIGQLALYKQDWLHHYPQWNQWATDPDKNGGPFMDAMIHNLNIVRYLMGRKALRATFFSDSHAHTLKCNDTEFMKLDFEDRGSAHLFITWAADLAVFSKEGNDREHIDLFYMVTDQGWRVTEGKGLITASKEGQTKTWPIESPAKSHFDRFADMLDIGGAMPSDLVDIVEAYQDIKMLEDCTRHQGQPVQMGF